jgi:hypothetical protein
VSIQYKKEVSTTQLAAYQKGKLKISVSVLKKPLTFKRKAAMFEEESRTV